MNTDSSTPAALPPRTVWVLPAVAATVAFVLAVGCRVLVSTPGNESAAANTPDPDANTAGAGNATPAEPAANDPVPDGAVAIGNELCPVLGKPVDPTIGTVVNGWWVNFCCPGCDKKLIADPDAYALDLLEQTGHDIRQPAGSTAGASRLEPGPDGTVRVGNATCPVMGNDVDPEVGTAFNGWWIGFCCPGCDKKFIEDPEAYAINILEQTGHDVRQAAPGSSAAMPWKPGPESTYRVGNSVCPVMGNPTDPDVGMAYNGWWITFCCPGCDKTFREDPDAYAIALRNETGIDVRVSPADTAAGPGWAEGPNGTRDLANAVCPVTGTRTGAVELGVEVNGWWVRVATPAAASVFATRLDQYAPVLKAATGVDVRHGLAGQMASAGTGDGGATTPLEAGPDGTVRLGNKTCPVLGNPVDPAIGVAWNGWWIGLCCAGCEEDFLFEPEEFAGFLQDETGRDIRTRPR